MREMPELKVEEIGTDELIPYANNAKIHTREQVDQICKSIEEFGFNDPIAVWEGPDGLEIVEGHGRVMAAKKLNIDAVPIIRLDHLSNEQRRAYTHIHNQLTMNTGWDFETLEAEREELEFDWERFGFDDENDELEDDKKYTAEVNAPLYEPTGDGAGLSELYDASKADKLVRKAENSGVSEAEKDFLIFAAQRHIVFDYGKIAEYYAAASAEMQKLMEESALVIIDFNDAIRGGVHNP